jgi:glycosyltransferase involved in cell wall biosynthesis
MKICSPHCGLAPETTSGGETYERELLLSLARLGVEIDVLLARGKPVPAAPPALRVHRLPIGRGLRWPVALFLLPPSIRRHRERVGFDVLRAHSLRFIGPGALWARRRYGWDVPVIAHHHHLDPSRLNGLIERRVIEGADHVVTGSEFAVRQLRAELGVRTDHVSVVPYGVDARFAPGPRRPELLARYGLEGKTVVLFLGGLKARKNLFLLLDVWREVVTARPDARLVVAGGGALRAALAARAAAAGIAETVVFTGYVPEQEKPAHYNLADVFVFPSAMEGFGLAIGEAMSSGLPVVASSRGSIPELYTDGEGGFLCDPERPAEFAARLQTLLADPALRERFGRANRDRVERHFRWERCATATRRVYERVLEARRSRARGPVR